MNPRRRIHLTAVLGFTAALLALPPARAADTILHSFTGGSSGGSNPYGSVTLSGSKLYGMTYGGGSFGTGTLFSMNTDGTGFSLLHSFDNSTGAYPQGSLTLSGSKLYGMTSGGGSFGPYGTIFSVNIDGTGYSVLRSFAGAYSDGSAPNGSLTLSGSKLYGMTYQGGSGNGGAVFSMNTNGTAFSLLRSFRGLASDGAYP